MALLKQFSLIILLVSLVGWCVQQVTCVWVVVTYMLQKKVPSISEDYNSLLLRLLLCIFIVRVCVHLCVCVCACILCIHACNMCMFVCPCVYVYIYIYILRTVCNVV